MGLKVQTMDDKDKARDLVRECVKDGVNAKMIGGVLANQGFSEDTTREVMHEFGIKYVPQKEKENNLEEMSDRLSVFLRRYSLPVCIGIGMLYLIALFYIDPNLFDSALRFFIISSPKAILCALLIKLLVGPFTGKEYRVHRNTWTKALILGYMLVLAKVTIAGLIKLNLITIVASLLILYLFWYMYDFPFGASLSLWIVLISVTFIVDVVYHMIIRANTLTFKEVINQAIWGGF